MIVRKDKDSEHMPTKEATSNNSVSGKCGPHAISAFSKRALHVKRLAYDHHFEGCGLEFALLSFFC
jgi:hypothetical protein